jgi:hypothetical protein
LSGFDDYLALVRRLGTGGINRSENDLSSNLMNAIESLGLYGVLDTGSGTNRSKRPDIALYVDRDDADLGGAADVVVESKKPIEVAQFPTLLDALIDNDLWQDKFVPYVGAHAERISYFILTTFERFLIVPIDTTLRSRIQDHSAYNDATARRAALENALPFDLRSRSGDALFTRWCQQHLPAEFLAPPPLSVISDILMIDSSEALETFATSLADIVVGPEGRATPNGALIAKVHVQADRLEDLGAEVQRALVVYTMAATGGMTVDATQDYLRTHWADELSEFVSASVHSLIGRLFAIKAIEDSFCIDTQPPLIPRDDWIFHTTRFDSVELDLLPQAFFAEMAGLAAVDNLAVQDLAATGRFYDWLATKLDPTAFRRLIALFFKHNFTSLNEDLLGRFFELYAQRVDRRRRKQLGQYYTPLPIVRHMWRLAMQIARDRGVDNDLYVLDPGVGSGTFLIEGANQLHAAGIPRFWERLNGFDISPQAICIAQTNVYLAVLAHLDRDEAEAVGSLRLYPTDALDPRNGARLRSIMPLLADESTRAFLRTRIDLSETVKQRSHFPLIIGNPPYRNNSNHTLAQIAERFPMLLRSSRANARARTRNIRDDYAWFFAAADHYVTECGMIAFVVSDSFCYATSYRFFREDLLRRYHVNHLIILGASIFRDVGPRTQFVIIVLERRELDLPRADETASFPVTDLRPLAVNAADTLGTPNDPRLVALDLGNLPDPVGYQPTRQRSFVFFPATDVVACVNVFPNVLHGDSPRRVFIKKWPGLITAFDELFKGQSRAEVSGKIERFFAAVRLNATAREAALDELARTIRATSTLSRSRLSLMASHASDGRLEFDANKVRRAVTGSAPNEVAWYPNEQLTAWVYYEPLLRIPRNVHEGRNPGYGTMSQWRDAQSHTVDPKFVFTTGTNPEYGLKALVVPGDWIVKLHGGESQQFHYTGLVNPLVQASLAGPNNLGDDARTFCDALVASGCASGDLLFYLAGIYNSQTSDDYLRGGGANVLRIPLAPVLIENGRAGRVITLSRQLRNLHWLLAEGTAGMEAALAEGLATRQQLQNLGFQEQAGSGGRFRQRPTWHGTGPTSSLIESEILSLRPQLDEAVTELYLHVGDNQTVVCG